MPRNNYDDLSHKKQTNTLVMIGIKCSLEYLQVYIGDLLFPFYNYDPY